jgi:hypothetical protein
VLYCDARVYILAEDMICQAHCRQIAGQRPCLTSEFNIPSWLARMLDSLCLLHYHLGGFQWFRATPSLSASRIHKVAAVVKIVTGRIPVAGTMRIPVPFTSFRYGSSQCMPSAEFVFGTVGRL